MKKFLPFIVAILLVTVLVACGSAARIGCNMDNSPVDAAIVGIVDSCPELEN